MPRFAPGSVLLPATLQRSPECSCTFLARTVLFQIIAQRFEFTGEEAALRRHLNQRWRPALVSLDENGPAIRQADVPANRPGPWKGSSGLERQLFRGRPIRKLKSE